MNKRLVPSEWFAALAKLGADLSAGCTEPGLSQSNARTSWRCGDLLCV
jgi:hypothetical protein